MGRKLKGKRLVKILEECWNPLKVNPAPTREQFAEAVVQHNASYVPYLREPDQRWWGDRNGGYDRRLPVVYQPKVEPKVNDTWTCSVAETKGCPIVGKPEVRMPVEMYRAWTELAQDFDTEWMAYLQGTFDAATGKGEIVGMYFPPQSASGAHVEMPDESFRVLPGTIGAVHSHVKMQAFFSGTDEAHANWPVEIVINAKGESAMRARVKLECGRFSRVDGTIMLVGTLPRYSDAYSPQLKEAMSKPQSAAQSTTDGDATLYDYPGGHFIG